MGARDSGEKTRRRKGVRIKESRGPDSERSENVRSVLSRIILRELYAIILLSFSILSLVCLFFGSGGTSSETAGAIENAIIRVFTGVFGFFAFMPSLIIGFIGFFMLINRITPKMLGKALGLALLILPLVTIYHMRTPGNSDLGLALNGQGGGILGAVMYELFVEKLFGYFGTFVVMGTILLIALALIASIPASSFLMAFVSLFTVIARAVWGIIARAGCLLKNLIMRQLEAEADAASDDEYATKRKRRPKRRGSDPAEEHEDLTEADVVYMPAIEFASDEGDGADRMPFSAAKSKSEKRTVTEERITDRDKKPEGAEGQKITGDQLRLLDEKQMYQMPSSDLLKSRSSNQGSRVQDSPDQSDRLEETLRSFGVNARVLKVHHGPVITRYEVQPAIGVKVSKIVNLADDIALALAASGIRIEAPIPGKSAVGIEVPNRDVATVYLKDIIDSQEFKKNKSKLAVAIGKDIAGNCIVGDLSKMVHLLVAGATGAGKSVCLNSIITSILFKSMPDEVKLLMIDPKRVELTTYDGIPHLIGPVVTDPKHAAGYLLWVIEQMEGRYKLFQAAGVRNITGYNILCEKGEVDEASGNPLPYIVVIIDELADLMMIAQSEVEDAISRLAYMARAAGIHLVLATQRPSSDIITGVIKANIPSRIAFSVSSNVDSRIILDSGGAEKLLGRGDMLYLPVGASKPIRIQGAYISDNEVEVIVDFLKEQGEPEYVAERLDRLDSPGGGREDEDELFDDAVRVVMEAGHASASLLQRRFRIGYSRAARLIDQLEARGIVGPHEGSKPRKILVERSNWELESEE